MSGVVAAVVQGGAAVVGAVTSRNASKRAADTAQKTSDAQIAYMREAEERARQDINTLFPQATQRRAQGLQQQMDLLSAAMPQTLNFMQQGNVGAQNVLSGSMPQIQNAILGGAIDYGFMQPQQFDYQASIQSLLAGLPQLYSNEQQQQVTSPNIGQTPFYNQPSNTPVMRGGSSGERAYNYGAGKNLKLR